MSPIATLVLSLLSCIYITGVFSLSFEEDTRITASQADILGKFRNRVKPILQHKYMEENIYLVRWLRARQFDLDRAEKMLRQHLKWRLDNNIDNIGNEDWEFFETEYPINQQGFDREGRPLVQFNLGQWNLRKAAVTGRMTQLIRWTMKFFEDGTKRVRKQQDEGKNVTQFTPVVGMDGFSPLTHTCDKWSQDHTSSVLVSRMCPQSLTAFGVLVCCYIIGVASVSFDDDTSLTAKQAEILEEFRQRVKSILPHKYMEESIYLFNLDRAEEMLRKNLKWRSDNNIDEIDNEDWQLFETEYPINQEGFDKQGRPLVQIHHGEWNIRKAAVSGQLDRLIRWTYKYFEDGSKRVRKLQQEGKNVTQFSVVTNIEGINPVTYTCPICMPYHFAIVNGFEDYFNGNVHKFHAVQVSISPQIYNKMGPVTLTIFSVLICFYTTGVVSVSFEEDTRLTASQAETLAKFQQRVKPILPHKYMEDSIYLVRFLRARQFDLDRAEEMLRKNLKWRSDNKIDDIDNEDWDLFESEYPVNQNGFDKQGRPLVQVPMGEWNIRRAAVTGRMDRLIRWVHKFFEDGAKRVRNLQSNGKNVTQFTILLNLEGFSPVTTACPICMPFFFSIIRSFEENYNGNVDKFHTVQVIEVGRVLIRLVWPVISENTRKTIVTWGTNRNEWRTGLLKEIDDNQLTQMSLSNAPLVLSVMLACFYITAVVSISFEEDTRLTIDQAEILAKFRKRVQPILSRKYMEESIYLVRWLRARQFDINRAEEMLRQHLKWRTDNNLDNIENEDWQLFETEYPINQEGFDKQGRPLVQVNFGEWNLRKAAITGRMNKLIRWTYKFFEDASKRVREQQTEGKNVTQFTAVMGLDGFSPLTHTCALCMRYYFTLLNVYEEQYNGNIDKTHALGVIEPVRVVIRLVLPLLSENTKQGMVFWGTNRDEWKAGLKRDIEGSQLIQTFGGTLDATNSL
ncbi:SEC14-like protein 2 [Orchesella cincta]|uniref:SEC14-like protein 2 n=1 Tax=Orchesella cincta TaxID=48709 RepID=A0A1D2NAT7_ORCCI|nr:SEC14-like protein 2 [Orchesella cincta]